MTAPVVLLSAAPAFADERPTALGQRAQSTIEELQRAVDRAQKEYDAAVLAVEEAITFLTEGMEEETHPTKAAVIEAEKAAEAAAKVETEAGQAVVDARAALDEAATDEEKATAQTALDKAEKAALEAAQAKKAADTEATEARTAHEDARVAQTRRIGALQKVQDEAEEKLDDAKKALADAKAGEEEEPGGECVPEPRLTTVVSGLEDRIVGGTTENFTLRVTNGTSRTMDEVYLYTAVHAFANKSAKELGSYLDLEWSTAADPKWRDAGVLSGPSVGALEPKASADVKLRLKVDADVPAGQGVALVAADYFNEDGSCGGYPDFEQYEFRILAKGSDPGKDKDAEDTPGTTDNTTGQGGRSATPASTTAGGVTGTLAATGAGDTVQQAALAGGAALVLGVGAMAAARRRTARTGA
uniref:peptidase n=1 Tax=Streptomyces sp. CHD11 TaxID=2741325 RepID=UPI0027E4BA15|nr:peptidase [Streptomyces sp. CHD11]